MEILKWIQIENKLICNFCYLYVPFSYVYVGTRNYEITRVKQRVSERVSPRVLPRPSPWLFGAKSLGKSLTDSLAKSLTKSHGEGLAKSLAKSLRLDPMHDSQRDSLQDSFFYTGRPILLWTDSLYISVSITRVQDCDAQFIILFHHTVPYIRTVFYRIFNFLENVCGSSNFRKIKAIALKPHTNIIHRSRTFGIEFD